jgi:hypothetical protein
MRVLPHNNHGAMSMESAIEPESTWLIIIRNTEVAMDDDAVDHFLIDLKTHLANDECMLHLSKNSPRLISLRIHCPPFTPPSRDDTIGTQQEKQAVPPLSNTLDYLNPIFGADKVTVSINGIRSINDYQEGILAKLRTPRHHRKSVSSSSAFTSNEVQENVAWNLHRIATRNDPSSKSAYSYTNDGTGVDVYVLDTGIRADHVEFEGRAVFLHNAVPDGINTDCNGHGTHVAGTIGSAQYGVAKKVTLYGVRVLNCTGEGAVDDILEGVDVILGHVAKRTAANPKQRSVINLSLGGEKSEVMDMLIMSLRDAGIVVVLAAGNANNDACNFSPSSLGKDNYALSIGASDTHDRRASFSNYGNCVNLFAPGVNIPSTWYTSNTATKTISGTSMAAPAATGVVALVLEQNDQLTVEEVNRLVLGWATPNVVSANRGSENSPLLYSRIDLNTPLAEARHLALRDIQTSDAPSTNVTRSTMLLCISVTLLWITCLF